jgi:hypothetical protein
MSGPWRVWLLSLSCVAAALFVGGCSGGVRGAKVSGQVLQNGKPIKLLAQEEVSVGFSAEALPEGQKAVTAWAPISPQDGSFTVAGPDGHGIPAGKYTVVVSSRIYQQTKDRFESIFEKKPPLTVDVTADPGQQIIVDIGTRTVTRR